MPSSGDNKARFIGDFEVETGPRGDEVCRGNIRRGPFCSLFASC